MQQWAPRISAALWVLFLWSSSTASSVAQELPRPPLQLLEGTTQTLNQGKLSGQAIDPETELWVFYFGASWCAPCRAFMPELRQAHERWQEQARGIELVFVSADGSCEAMESYVRQMRMPWQVIACRRRDGLPAIQRLADGTLPGLVVVDPSGTIIDSSFWPEQYGQYGRVLRALN